MFAAVAAGLVLLTGTAARAVTIPIAIAVARLRGIEQGIRSVATVGEVSFFLVIAASVIVSLLLAVRNIRERWKFRRNFRGDFIARNMDSQKLVVQFDRLVPGSCLRDCVIEPPNNVL